MDTEYAKAPLSSKLMEIHTNQQITPYAKNAFLHTAFILSATIRSYYFRADSCRDDDYRKAMNELTGFSFTMKNVHDDAADSLAMLADYLSNGIKSVSVGKRPF